MLTPDDVRCLMIGEDELARSAPLERIFPTANTHKYHRFIEHPRYYNRLLDAWENRYGAEGRRDDGIALLRKFCQNKIHLCVPPPPVKKVITFRSNSLVLGIVFSVPWTFLSIYFMFFLYFPFYFSYSHFFDSYEFIVWFSLFFDWHTNTHRHMWNISRVSYVTRLTNSFYN